MNIKIRKLTPDLAEDYARFFDTTPHDDKTDKDELPCYCVTWRSDASYERDNHHWFPTRGERRERAIHFVKTGSLQGYLAYEGFDFVEAYVHENFSDVPHDFRGPLVMYEKCGFIRQAEQEGMVVLRKGIING